MHVQTTGDHAATTVWNKVFALRIWLSAVSKVTLAKEKLGFTNPAGRMCEPVTSSRGVKSSAKNRGNVTPRSLRGSYTSTLKQQNTGTFTHLWTRTYRANTEVARSIRCYYLSIKALVFKWRRQLLSHTIHNVEHDLIWTFRSLYLQWHNFHLFCGTN